MSHATISISSNSTEFRDSTAINFPSDSSAVHFPDSDTDDSKNKNSDNSNNSDSNKNSDDKFNNNSLSCRRVKKTICKPRSNILIKKLCSREYDWMLHQIP